MHYDKFKIMNYFLFNLCKKKFSNVLSDKLFL